MIFKIRKNFKTPVMRFIIFGAMSAFVFGVRAESFVTNGRPLSFYGMTANSTIHGASAVPFNRQLSATQYYNGVYTGSPNYYVATNKTGNEAVGQNISPIISPNVSLAMPSYRVFYPATSYGGHSGASTYSGLPASAGLIAEKNSRQNPANQTASAHYGGYTPPGPYYGALVLPSFAFSKPIPGEETSVKAKTEEIKNKKMESQPASLARNIEVSGNEGNAGQITWVGYVDYIKNRYGNFWNGVLGN